MFFSEVFHYLFNIDLAEPFRQYGMPFWLLFILGCTMLTYGIWIYRKRRQEQRIRRVIELWNARMLAAREPQLCPEEPVTREDVRPGGGGGDCMPWRVGNSPYRRKMPSYRLHLRKHRLH